MNKKQEIIEIEEVQEKGLAMRSDAEALISRAIDKNVSVETMERLLAMRRELKAEFAKEEFDKAMAEFQSECPTIKKTKNVYEKDKRTVRYCYAPLESIVEQSKELLSKHGFSYSINTIQDDKMLGVICRATHRCGHAQETTFSVPIGSEGFMSDVQKYGARLTFAKRYAFCNAFGILTGDEDNDANSTHETAYKPNMPTLIDPKKLKIDRVLMLMKEKNKSAKDLERVLAFLKIKGLNYATEAQLGAMITNLKNEDEEVDVNEINI